MTAPETVSSADTVIGRDVIEPHAILDGRKSPPAR
jgi:hypothetical protein